MTRWIIRLGVRLWLLCLLLPLAGMFIGKRLPPEPLALFTFNNAPQTSMVLVDTRTGVHYRRQYPFQVMLDTWCMATLDINNQIVLMDLYSGRQVATEVRAEYLNAMRFSFNSLADRWWTGYPIGETGQYGRRIINWQTGALLSSVSDEPYLEARWSPDSHYLLEFRGIPPSTPDGRPSADMSAFIVNTDSGDSTTMPASLPYKHAWSPDSTRLALVKVSGTVEIADIHGQVQARLTQFNDIQRLFWEDNQHVRIYARQVESPDDRTTPYTIQHWSPDDNSLTQDAWQFSPGDNFRFSPDSNLAYLPGPPGSGEPETIIDARTGETVMSVPPVKFSLGIMWSTDGRYLMLVREDATLQISDTVTRQTFILATGSQGTPYPILGTNDMSLFVGHEARLIRLHSTDTGIDMESLVEPGATGGEWCYPRAIP